jgi:uncharacterized protein YqfB (UPF0267 family)
MIFQHTYGAILEGRKTRTTRRPGKVIYKPGHTYSVQPGRAKKSLGRIRILSREEFCSFDAMPADYFAGEGFESAEEFRATYARINGPDALKLPCIHYEFEIA